MAIRASGPDRECRWCARGVWRPGRRISREIKMRISSSSEIVCASRKQMVSLFSSSSSTSSSQSSSSSLSS
eukprot:1167148-Rhodomonas_salina.2